MRNAMEIFGCQVFGDRAMRERLPKDAYKTLQRTIKDGRKLDPAIANIVANAMKDWAIEKGVTHYTHWFQPMTGITAEKHDSFLAPYGEGVIMEFSGKELIKGEPDASSFPSGGMRSTFEARGYTSWDPTSYAFIKENVLCIPTAFVSYGGEALDKKTPLLRSMEVISKSATRVLNLLGRTDITSVTTTVGAEQEYFLIDRETAKKRRDLFFCGRTLFGAPPPKGQEMDDHYFGTIRPRVQAFMNELNEELWKLGVYAKTEHNEAAPSQHELAPVYATTNIATDHNQLTMEMMKRVAEKHGLLCLLHEKPFTGVNGSGKHNNWSLSSNTGENLLDPGENPAENLPFLLFLAAVIQAVDDYQALLRLCVASAGNDHRLGAHEAPPSILSIFLGGELTAALEAIEKGEAFDAGSRAELKAGVHTLARFEKDNTDRNRTSPLAFTGNKFEFRMVGSTFSIAGPNFCLNTIVAESLEQIAHRLENCADVRTEAMAAVRDIYAKHKRIIFNGNNYSKEWEAEAEKRGLLNLKTTPDALPYFVSEKIVTLFTKHRILTEAEIHSRYEILMENYTKTLRIEASTFCEIARKDILPAILRYAGHIAECAVYKRQLNVQLSCELDNSLVGRLSSLADTISTRSAALDAANASAEAADGIEKRAFIYRDEVVPAMRSLRAAVDEAETIVAREFWPFPTYGELLFSV